MNMIEKVARAICKTRFGHLRGFDSYKQGYLKEARAAIEAMREPTEEMLNVDAPDMPAGGSIDEVWKAMIDKALEE